MTVVGSAEVIVHANTAFFRRELEASTAPAFGGLEKDAERAGTTAGDRMHKGMGRGIAGIAENLAGLSRPLGAFGGGLDQAAKKMGEVEKHGQGMNATMSHLGGQVLLGATAGLLAFGAAAVDSAAKYQSSTTTLAANANISVAAATRISKAFLDTSGHSIYSAQTINTAYASVAGELGAVEGHALGARDAMRVMSVATNLAEGSGIALTNATGDLANVMQAYHLSVGQASAATDVLFSTSKVTGIGLDTLTSQLDRMKARLGSLAPSLGESAGLLDELAKRGVTGRTAMSVLNAGFNTLLGGGKNVTAMAKELGISIYDAQGKFVGMQSIITQLQPKLSQYTQESQLQATKALFGAGANKQLLDVILQGPAAYAADTAAVTRSGAAKQAAEKQAGTLAHQIDLLKATAVDLAIKFGNILLPKVIALGQGLADGIGWLEKHKTAAIALATVIATVLGAAVAIFVSDKIAAFVGGLDRLVARFATMRGAVATTAGTVTAEGAVMDTSFAATGSAAQAAAAEVGVAEATMATAAETASATIVTANETAGLSFTALLGKINPVIAAIGAVVAAEPFINNLTGGGLTDATLPSNYTGPGASAQNLLRGLPSLTATPQVGTLGITSPLPGLSKGSNANKIASYLSGQGFSKTTIAGILGNFAQENGGQTLSGISSAITSGGIGIGQWIGSRATALRALASKEGKSPSDLAVQLQFLDQELRGPYHSAYSQTAAAGSPQAAALAFEQGYERAGIPNNPARERLAAQAFKMLSSSSGSLQLPMSGSLTLPSLTGVKTRKAPATYLSPFLNPAGLTIGRTDQGVDVSGLHAGAGIGAIGAGTIDAIIQNWYKGQPLIEETLTSGSRKGQHVYYAEQLTPGVKVGQKVAAGQRIAGVAASGTGLELGFGAGGGRTLAQATTGYTEGQVTTAGKQFSSFMSSLGHGGGTVLSVALQTLVSKVTTDAKTGQTVLNRLLGDIHSGSMMQLRDDVNATHSRQLVQLEKVLSSDHTSALDNLTKKLVQAHKDALDALSKALEKQAADRLSYNDKIAADQAANTAKAITAATKITLDMAAEAGKTGADLAAAQAQTVLDRVTAGGDAAIGAAQVKVDQAANKGVLAQAQAADVLAQAQNWTTVETARAQATLDLANNAAQAASAQAAAAQAAAQTVTAATPTATNTPTSVAPIVPAVTPTVTNYFTINGAHATAQDLATEIGWALRTGALPIAAAPVGA